MTQSEICYINVDIESSNIVVKIDYFQRCHMKVQDFSLYMISSNVLPLNTCYHMAQAESPYVGIDINSSHIRQYI